MWKLIGSTGVKVFPIGLGAMPLSIASRPHRNQAIQVIQTAVEHGINFIDTADCYCLDEHDIGHNEKLIVEALKDHPKKEKTYIATKGGVIRPGGSWSKNASPKHLRAACEASLKNLEVEQIFLYQLHAPDAKVPFEDSLGELAKLQDEGKICHIGLSNVGLEHLQKIPSEIRIETVQNRLNPQHLEDLEDGVFEFCIKNKCTYIAYSPFGGAYGHQGIVVHPTLHDLAIKYRCTPYQIILSWMMGLGDYILPIPGASKVSSLLSSIESVEYPISKEDAQKVLAMRKQPI